MDDDRDTRFLKVGAFSPFSCPGFDILRTHDGRNLVCDVNGWSFVKKSRKYYDDCAALLAEHMEHRRAAALAFRPRVADGRSASSDVFVDDTHLESLRRSPSASSVGSTPGLLEAGTRERSDSQPGRATPSGEEVPAAKPHAHTWASEKVPIRKPLDQSTFDEATHKSRQPPKRPQQTTPSQRELRCVIAVVRHGDRTPKRKLKVKTKHPSLVGLHATRADRAVMQRRLHGLEANAREQSTLWGGPET